MLGAMRTAAGSWVAKLFFIVLVASFAVWGIGGRIEGGSTSNSVLTAGDTSVSLNEYRLAYDRQISTLSQQIGRRVTREQATALGVDQRVLSQLLGGAVLDEQARRLGLGISNTRIADLTRDDPAFQGTDGRFSRQQFDYVLRQVGMRPEEYMQSQQQAAVRRQLVDAATEGMKAPDAFLKAVALYRGEDRTVEYITMPRSLVEPIEDPSDSTLQAWFEKNKTKYAAPEYRKIAYVRLEPQDIADTASVSDEQVKQDYEAHLKNYTTPEKRTVEQIVFKDETAAGAALASVKGGATFDDIAKSQGKTEADTKLGTFAKSEIPEQKIADAAFSLKVGEVSPVVQGAFGPVLLRVTSVTPEAVKPLSDVSDQIRKDLALGDANRDLLDVHDSWEDARAGGATMQEAADKLKLKVVTVDAIDREGRAPDGTVVKGLPESEQLIKDAFESDKGIENDPISTKNDGFVYYEIRDIKPAHDRTLEEVHAKALADWKTEEATSRLGAKATEMEKKAKAGTSLDEIATELKLEKETKRGVKRDSGDPDLGQNGVAAVFGVGQGGIGLFSGSDDKSQVLFKVAETFEPAGAGPDSVDEQARKMFASGMANDLLQQVVNKLQAEYGVTVDRSAIQRAMAF
ncbi:MAG: SurA N-terminal domain-containing protein [Hyphomicrobiales bacterium]|nr:SurA N-terminal domain-containing protein [Hyphomicrobiales bacterium]